MCGCFDRKLEVDIDFKGIVEKNELHIEHCWYVDVKNEVMDPPLPDKASARQILQQNPSTKFFLRLQYIKTLKLDNKSFKVDNKSFSDSRWPQFVCAKMLKQVRYL